jgi:hypothetical protein
MFTIFHEENGRLQYLDKIKMLNILSLQRRRERYLIIHVWKILNDMAPNDMDFEFQTKQRLGIKACIPPINNKAQMSVKADYDKTFRVKQLSFSICYQ